MPLTGYSDWDLAIRDFFFRPGQAGEWICLGVDAPTLARIGDYGEPEEAVTDFRKAVSDQVRRRGWDESLRFFGLLAAQVHAAYEMAADEEFSENNYWPRLCALLKCRMAAGRPQGLSYELHQTLWRSRLVGYLERRHRGQLGLVRLPPDSGSHRHIRLPLSQALLRQEERFRLLDFFDRHGFQPQERLAPDALWTPLRSDLNTARWTSHARRLFHDENRREAALEQALQILESWDGATAERHSRKFLRLWVGLRRQGARRVLQGGLAERADSGLWQTCRGVNLPDCLRGSISLAPGHCYRPLRKDSLHLLVAEPTGSWFLERRTAPPGSYLVLVGPTGLLQRLYTQRDGEVEGWEALSGPIPSGRQAVLTRVLVGPRRRGEWAQLLDRDPLRIRLEGGLKLARDTWMQGAGPRLALEGETIPIRLWVGQRSVEPVEGVVEGALNEAGLHRIRIPGHPQLQVVVRIAAPRAKGAVPAFGWTLDSEGWPARRPDPSEPCLIGLSAQGSLIPVSLSPEPPGPEPEPLAPDLTVRLLLAERTGLPFVSANERERARSAGGLMSVLAARVTP